MPEEFSILLDALSEELRAQLPASIFENDTASVGAAATELSDYRFLLAALLESIGIHLRQALGVLASLAGVLLLSSVLAALRSSLSRNALSRAFSMLSSLVILSAVATCGYETAASVSDALSSLCALTNASLPMMGAVYAMGGNLTAAAASSAALTIYMTLMETIIGKTVVPFCCLCLSLSWIGVTEPTMRVGTLLATLKKKYATLLSFLMMLLLAMLGAQGTLAARADTLAMRSARFAVGNLLPVVGGSVGELLRTVSAGVGYLRGVLGVCGVLFLLLTLLPTIARLLLFRTVWQAAASLADFLGCDGERRLLEEIASLNGHLTAAVCICSSVPLLALTLFARCASAIG